MSRRGVDEHVDLCHNCRAARGPLLSIPVFCKVGIGCGLPALVLRVVSIALWLGGPLVLAIRVGQAAGAFGFVAWLAGIRIALALGDKIPMPHRNRLRYALVFDVLVILVNSGLFPMPGPLKLLGFFHLYLLFQIVWTCRATLRATKDDRSKYYLLFGADDALVSVTPMPPPPAPEKPSAQEP